MFVPPTAPTGRDLTSRRIKEPMMKASKGRSSWEGNGRANNGGQQPKLLTSNIRNVSRAASELPIAQSHR